jgi:hypothetical protein
MKVIRRRDGIFDPSDDVDSLLNVPLVPPAVHEEKHSLENVK